MSPRVMPRPTLVVALAAVATGAVLAAAPAQAATYGVTLTINTSSADIGTKVTLSGKVSGKGSVKKSVVIQRKAGSAWKTIATTRTSAKSAYAKKITIRSTGIGVYRVAAKKAGSTATGYSPSRAVTGYRWLWLWLHQQTHTSFGGLYVGPLTQLGTAYPHSISMSGTNSQITWGLGNACDELSIKLAVPDYAGENAESQKLVLRTGSGSSTTHTFGQPPLPVTGAVSTSSEFLTISRPNSTASATVYLLSPKVHCSVDELPEPSL